MKRQAFQPGEIRDENDAIIREGAYGKKSAFATADNKGILDYMINNFDALYDAVNGGRVYVNSASDLPKTGDTAAVYIVEDSGKWYYWDPGTSKYVTMDNARTIVNEAIAARDAAKASQTAAKTSETNAKTSETNASNSQSAAASSASAAKTSETNAKSSQTAAASSASASASSASAAKTSQTAAATSETNAKTALVSCQNIRTQVSNGLQSLTSAVKYRGSVASFSALPTSGQSVGDMYNIKAAGGTDANGTAVRAGDNVVWNGSGWDDQAGNVDLSNYYTKSEVNKAIISTTVSNDTITFIHKDASKTTATVNNVGHATKASQDDKGQAIDISALKSLITSTSAYKNQLQRNKPYSVGDIAYSSYLPSWARMECVTAGATADTIPPALGATHIAGQYITDGTAVFILDDVRDGDRVGDIVLKPTLNDGYIKANGATVRASEYPRLLKFVQDNSLCVSDSEWMANSATKYMYDASADTLKVPNAMGRVLQGENALATKNAGLPNITGYSALGGFTGKTDKSWGAMQKKVLDQNAGFTIVATSDKDLSTLFFDASMSNAIYGASDTVQPPACCLIAQIKY